jgi:hypothetical protein
MRLPILMLAVLVGVATPLRADVYAELDVDVGGLDFWRATGGITPRF